jgi:aspartate/glutamate racemase
MAQDLSQKTLGMIHAAVFTAQTVQPYIDEFLPEVNVVHVGDDTIQRDFTNLGPGKIPKFNYFRFTTYARFLEEAGVDLIMLACSTMNKAVELARPMINTPMLQIDRPMMDLAVQTGRKIGLLCTLATTVPSSERLLRLAAEEAGKDVEIHTVLAEEAFKVLRSGDPQGHNEMLLAEIDRLSRTVDCIVLAQVSMSVLEPHLGDVRVPVYNSGRTGFTKAREILESL